MSTDTSGSQRSSFLTPTSYVVLGLVAWMQPTTPYDLKQATNLTIGNFWTFPHTQLYTEPVRLADAGLLTEEREDGGRRRRLFSITDPGRAALAAWLTEASDEPTEVRDRGLLQLFFSGHADPTTTVAIARVQRLSHERRLEGYAAQERVIREQLDPPAQRGPLFPHPTARARALRQATLSFGLTYERAAVEFWRAIEAAPPGAAEQ
ncbi:MAG: PadR family transcriptional regulator [Thermoleophilaceae bacterium]